MGVVGVDIVVSAVDSAITLLSSNVSLKVIMLCSRGVESRLLN